MRYNIGESKIQSIEWGYMSRMGIKKRLAKAACTILAVVTLTQPAYALPLTSREVPTLMLPERIGITSILGDSIDSRIAAGTSLSEEEAALRLYYLGLITGTGVNTNGGVEFALTRGLSRLEAAVLAVRLMGAEATAEKANFPHPYEDVPGWASAYIGYMFNRGLLSYIGDKEFSPNTAVTANEFMSFVLYALGYRMKAGDYTLITAASLAKKAGICAFSEDQPITRGRACAAMYNALRATMKDSKKLLSNRLVEIGTIDYQDAMFLLWSKDKEETEKYMTASGYGMQWIVPDGYYTITSTANGKNLNVAADGANSDYEGVGITLWDATEDVTQTFRLERTERGTYLIYSAASKSGFGRVIGSARAEGSASGLYRSNSYNAMEYIIEGSVDGTWTIFSAENKDLVLSCGNPNVNVAAVTLEKKGASESQTWTISRQGVMNASGEELAIFCCNSLSITQGAYDVFSHQHQNALDMTPVEGRAFAPFNSVIVDIDYGYAACNAVWIESTEKVRYADGTYDYMTVCFMHDNYISDLYVGMGLKQGDWFYDSGNAGYASGIHIHVAAYRGKFHHGMRLGSGDVFIEDAFFLPDDTYVLNTYGLDWVVISQAN